MNFASPKIFTFGNLKRLVFKIINEELFTSPSTLPRRERSLYGSSATTKGIDDNVPLRSKIESSNSFHIPTSSTAAAVKFRG